MAVQNKSTLSFLKIDLYYEILILYGITDTNPNM